MKEDLMQIYICKRIFDANIFCAEGGKKKGTYLQRDICSKFMSYISLYI